VLFMIILDNVLVMRLNISSRRIIYLLILAYYTYRDSDFNGFDSTQVHKSCPDASIVSVRGLLAQLEKNSFLVRDKKSGTKYVYLLSEGFKEIFLEVYNYKSVISSIDELDSREKLTLALLAENRITPNDVDPETAQSLQKLVDANFVLLFRKLGQYFNSYFLHPSLIYWMNIYPKETKSFLEVTAECPASIDNDPLEVVSLDEEDFSVIDPLEVVSLDEEDFSVIDLILSLQKRIESLEGQIVVLSESENHLNDILVEKLSELLPVLIQQYFREELSRVQVKAKDKNT
jgi:hypothetical protein